MNAEDRGLAGSRRSGADVATGTVWVCSKCGNERRRAVVPVGLLNDAREELHKCQAELAKYRCWYEQAAKDCLHAEAQLEQIISGAA